MILIPLTLVGLGIFLFWNHQHWRGRTWPTEALHLPVLQAHRGYHHIEQENTIAAFRAAHAQGATMLELDVRLSKDMVPIVFHDMDFQRIANRREQVCDLNLQEIQSITAAPTLKEVLADFQLPYYVNIELKNQALISGKFERAVAQVVREAKAEDRVLFSSFNPLCIYRLEKCIPEVPRALLASAHHDPGNKIYLRKLWLAPYVKAHLLHLDHRYVSLSDIQKYKKRGIPVALWTVNDPQIAAQFLRAGAISIISDDLMKVSDLKV